MSGPHLAHAVGFVGIGYTAVFSTVVFLFMATRHNKRGLDRAFNWQKGSFALLCWFVFVAFEAPLAIFVGHVGLQLDIWDALWLNLMVAETCVLVMLARERRGRRG